MLTQRRKEFHATSTTKGRIPLFDFYVYKGRVTNHNDANDDNNMLATTFNYTGTNNNNNMPATSYDSNNTLPIASDDDTFPIPPLPLLPSHINCTLSPLTEREHSSHVSS